MWSKKWTENLVLTKEFDAFPIQFANCDRIEAKNAVYIFDEVGSGKTTSAALMALHYLYHRNIEEHRIGTGEEKDVLVITINSLVKSGEGKLGQFLEDWKKLPFMSEAADDTYNFWGVYKNKNGEEQSYIKLINNHYSNISYYEQKNVGLLIVDEAHLFLEDTRRRAMLEQIRAEKVIFLTATPIKHDKYDLSLYSDIAGKILNEENNGELVNELLSEKKKMISARFDISSPVTRYFKDTIMALGANEIDDFEKKQSKRLLPHLWKYTGNRIETMLQKMKEIWDRENDNTKIPSRFVIFTRYIEKESEKIEKYLQEYRGGDYQFVKSPVAVKGKKAYYSVNGTVSRETGIRPTNFSGKNDLPDILILTYQMAEQGVNLPGYNYVVNYHISAFPASLEQRFGRVDRMGERGSLYPEIHICYLISERRYSADIYTINFYAAVSTYLYSLLTQIPAKNVLLSEEIIRDYRANRGLVFEYFQRIKEICNNEKDDLKLLQIEEIARFCQEYDLKEDVNREVLLDKVDRLWNKFKAYDNKIEASDEAYTTYVEVIKRIQDKIFYYEKNYPEIHWKNIGNALRTVDAIKEEETQLGCAQQITDNSDYQKYKSCFLDEIKLPKLFERYATMANSYFEKKFEENKFEDIFMYGKTRLLECEEWQNVKKEHRELLYLNWKRFEVTIPFFRMIEAFREELLYVAYNQEGDIRKRIDFHEIRAALMRLKYRVSELGMSNEFIQKYWEEKSYADFTKMIRIERKKENQLLEATNWYKLAFHCLHSNIYSVIYCYLFFDIHKKNPELFQDENWEKMNKVLRGEHSVNRYGNAFRRKLLTYSGYWGKTLEEYKYDLSGCYPYNNSYKISPSDIWTYGIYWETMSCDATTVSYTQRQEFYEKVNEKYRICSEAFWKSFILRLLLYGVGVKETLIKIDFYGKEEIVNDKRIGEDTYQKNHYIDYYYDDIDEC